MWVVVLDLQQRVGLVAEIVPERIDLDRVHASVGESHISAAAGSVPVTGSKSLTASHDYAPVASSRPPGDSVGRPGARRARRCDLPPLRQGPKSAG